MNLVPSFAAFSRQVAPVFPVPTFNRFLIVPTG